jgi:hypothetical protein
LPYVGLYTIVHLKQSKLREITVPTAFSPPLSILHNGQWENAPNQTVPTTPNAAYIFDSLAVNASGQLPSPGAIPLHPDQPYYSHNRYWRLQHTTLSGILSAVILHSSSGPSTADDLKMVRVLHDLLKNRKAGGVDAGPSGEGHREDGGGQK